MVKGMEFRVKAATVVVWALPTAKAPRCTVGVPEPVRLKPKFGAV